MKVDSHHDFWLILRERRVKGKVTGRKKEGEGRMREGEGVRKGEREEER